jgi:hypothetical protein
MFQNGNIRITVLAAATLLLESALLRLFAVAQFYHFAFLVVSLALLGFGASGSLLSVWPRRFYRGVRGASLGFALSVALIYAVVNLLPFDSYSIAWDARQVYLFALYYLTLTLPFLFAGLGIGGALAASEGKSHLVYAANLLGSGVGALLAPLILWLAGVPGAVLASGLIGLAAAFPVRQRWLHWGMTAAAGASLILLIGLIIFNLSGRAPLGMTISPYKGLAQAQRYPGSSLIFRRWNAISRVDVIANAGTRQLPGLSYAYPGTPPPQYGLSLDGDSPQPITLISPESFHAAAYLPESLVFDLRPDAQTLILEPGAGLGVLQALSTGGREVTAVVGNPLQVDAVARAAPDSNVYAHPHVQTVLETGRVFLQRVQGNYTIIFLPLTDSYRPVTSGAFSLSENYMLTVEAFEGALARLPSKGILTTTRWLQSPPSEEIRLIATLAEALERRGANPAMSIVAYRGIQTMTVLVQPDGWGIEELAQVRAFTEDRKFDLVWAPDIQLDEVNRFNRLPQPDYYLATQTLLTTPEREAFYGAYPFDIRPPSDNHPFFFHFFTWKQTPEIFATLGRTWQPFGGSGYFVLLALLALVFVLSGILIVAPLFFRRPHLSAFQGEGVRVRVLLYFTCLGIAFLFVEIPLIQRWILLLGHPTYAFAAVVVTLLTFSSMGSALARHPRLQQRAGLGALVLLAFLTPFGVSWLVEITLGWPLALRVGLAVLSLAPLAVLMGLPFPLGLAWLEREALHLVPWAWAVNGCASVIASVLAAMLTLNYGFTLVLLLGAGAYALAFGLQLEG